MSVSHPSFDKLFLSPNLLHPGVKPTGEIDFNKDHALSKDANIISPFLDFGTLAKNLADYSNHGIIDTSNISWANGRYGKLLDAVIDNTGIDYSCPFSGSQNRTVLFLHVRRVAHTNNNLVSAGTNATNERWTLRYTTGSALRIEIAGSGYDSSIVPPIDELSMTALVLDGTTLGDHLFYCNGQTESTSGAATVNTTGSTYTVFGDPFLLAATGPADELYGHYCFSRALSVTELDSLYFDFWQMLKPKGTELIPTPALAGVIITPTTATISITGQDVTVLSPTLIDVATGILSIAGQIVDVDELFVIAPSTASINIAGQIVDVDAVFVQIKKNGIIYKIIGPLVDDLLKELM